MSPTGPGRPEGGSPRRSLMSDHHLTGRVWATAALVAAVLHARTSLGWWLPLHLALLGTASQLIVGGQLMFSSTVTRAREPRPVAVRGQLGLLNAGVVGVVVGRLFGSDVFLVVGGSAVPAGVVWAALVVHRMWRSSLDRRFESMRRFYGAAAVSLVLGATIGVAMGTGLIRDGYLGHRLAHTVLNLYGWAGFTILGTAVTLVPTVLRVRAAEARGLKWAPWAGFGALLMMVTGLTTGFPPASAAGGILLLVALVPVAESVRRVVVRPRRRRIAVSGIHLLAALGWLGVVVVVQVPLLGLGRTGALGDLWVVGLAGGCVLQAVLGAWGFLLPAARTVPPERRRRELVAFELGAVPQGIAYNGGLLTVLLALGGLAPRIAGPVGIVLVLGAGAWALLKTWAFPLLARSSTVAARSAAWWATG